VSKGEGKTDSISPISTVPAVRAARMVRIGRRLFIAHLSLPVAITISALWKGA